MSPITVTDVQTCPAVSTCRVVVFTDSNGNKGERHMPTTDSNEAVNMFCDYYLEREVIDGRMPTITIHSVVPCVMSDTGYDVSGSITQPDGTTETFINAHVVDNGRGPARNHYHAKNRWIKNYVTDQGKTRDDFFIVHMDGWDEVFKPAAPSVEPDPHNDKRGGTMRLTRYEARENDYLAVYAVLTPRIGAESREFVVWDDTATTPDEVDVAVAACTEFFETDWNVVSEVEQFATTVQPMLDAAARSYQNKLDQLQSELDELRNADNSRYAVRMQFNWDTSKEVDGIELFDNPLAAFEKAYRMISNSALVATMGLTQVFVIDTTKDGYASRIVNVAAPSTENGHMNIWFNS